MSKRVEANQKVEVNVGVIILKAMEKSLENTADACDDYVLEVLYTDALEEMRDRSKTTISVYNLGLAYIAVQDEAYALHSAGEYKQAMLYTDYVEVLSDRLSKYGVEYLTDDLYPAHFGTV